MKLMDFVYTKFNQQQHEKHFHDQKPRLKLKMKKKSMKKLNMKRQYKTNIKKKYKNKIGL